MERELATIQKREKLNTVTAIDEIGPGGANHKYQITSNEDEEKGIPARLFLTTIEFQKGPRKITSSQNGVIDSDLLEIVRDRLKSFQAGPFASDDNAHALTHIEEALMWLNKRVEDRIERNVLGKNEK